jgi:hypothetical protein
MCTVRVYMCIIRHAPSRKSVSGCACHSLRVSMWCVGVCTRVPASVLKEIMKQIMEAELSNTTYQVCVCVCVCVCV